jgi:hypothetical protein
MDHPELPDDVDLAHLAEDDVLTTKQAAQAAGVRPSAINNWRERGYTVKVDGGRERHHLRNIGTDERPRYLALDVARAEHATRRPGVLRSNPLIAGLQIMQHRARSTAA